MNYVISGGVWWVVLAEGTNIVSGDLRHVWQLFLDALAHWINYIVPMHIGLPRTLFY